MNEVLVDIQRKPTEESGRVNEMVARSFLARISLFERIMKQHWHRLKLL